MTNRIAFPKYDREIERKEFNPRTRLILVQDNNLYLPVAARVEWFRSEHPDGRILTPLEIDQEKQTAIATAKVFVKTDGKMVCLAVGMACKTAAVDEIGMTDEIGKNYIECAQTAAVGRALAFAGYSTQTAIGSADAAELVELVKQAQQSQPPHEPVTDAPIKPGNTAQALPVTIAEAMAYPCSIKDYKGMTLGHMMQHQKAAYQWLVDMSKTNRLNDKNLQAAVLMLEQERARIAQQPQVS